MLPDPSLQLASVMVKPSKAVGRQNEGNCMAPMIGGCEGICHVPKADPPETVMTTRGCSAKVLVAFAYLPALVHPQRL